MKAARLIVLGVALAAGGAAAMLAAGLRQPEAPKAEPPPPPLATVDVLVAKTDLNTGQVVGASDIGWQIWPAASVNATFIKRTDRPDAIKDFEGAIVRSSLVAGEPIRDPKVVAAKGGGFMAAILPHGMRAISLDIAPDTGAGGFILPNDHVDVLLTRHDKATEKASGVEKFITETILRNVRVLAVDQAAEERDGKKVVIGKTATIELDPQQAEMLALSHQLGTLSLTLRSILDSQSPTPETAEDRDGNNVSVNTVRYGVSTQSTQR
jgi:pilus assembly protein CpaB